MARTRWTTLPGGRIRRWKKSRTDWRPGGWSTDVWPVPPRWYRNTLNRRERRRARRALFRGAAERFPYVHPREAPWFW